ncbi:hypothetical protein LCGC14_2229150 [marine sediment metagenome]|uniref:DNA (cytosine-5-)-methyltransferase n=1 Tax=marine sediment metagenome TaxID=412755 RepID=A0A0F9DWD4_9ZZZZ
MPEMSIIWYCTNQQSAKGGGNKTFRFEKGAINCAGEDYHGGILPEKGWEMTDDLTHVSLFTGIAGIDLAAEWAGFKTVCFVEIDEYCQKVLNKHWPEVPVIGDIRDVTKEKITAYADQNGKPRLPVNDEAGCRKLVQRRRSRNNNPAITLVTGGFPCQPVSHAGKRRGKADDRWLWPEMLRVISEIRPTWVIAENVAGLAGMAEPVGEPFVESRVFTRDEDEDILNKIYTRQEKMYFGDILSDLESEGYEVQPYLIPACGVNAPHQRFRIFIVGYSNDPGSGIRMRGKRAGKETNEERQGFSQSESGKAGDVDFPKLCTNPTKRRKRKDVKGEGSGRGNVRGRGDDNAERKESVGELPRGAGAAAQRPWRFQG